MESIEALASRCRVATPSDTVLHSECAYTFHSPYSSESGIVVNLNSFIGTIQELAFSNVSETKDVFLRIVKERVKKEVEEGKESETPTKLAIGVDGGFATDDDKYETISTYSVVVLESPNKVIVEMPYNESEKEKFPESVVKSVESVIHHVGLAIQQDLSAWEDNEEIPVTKYATDLPFVDNGVTISPDPKSWKCEKSGDTENLWLNLSDGFIGGGRKNWDGSGGSNGALDHFQETGEKYPLVVKLGTITSEGSTVHADCYSYAKDEDGPVKIPNLQELLAKRGIQVAGLQKTEKSTAELEVELNAVSSRLAHITTVFCRVLTKKVWQHRITHLMQSQKAGPNSSQFLDQAYKVVQVLSALPEFQKRYGTAPNGDITTHRFFSGVSPRNAPNDLLTQTARLVSALTSGKFSLPEDKLDSSEPADPKYRLAPRMFKHIIGKDHVDFKTGQQQDAAQFLQYLLEQIDRAEMKFDCDIQKTSRLFSFQTESRLLCSADQKIKYADTAPETVWSLRVPMERAVVIPASEKEEPEQKRLKQEEEKSIPSVSFDACLDGWSAEAILDDYRWPHLGNTVHTATQKTRFKNFPSHLWIQIQRYTLGPDWQPVKLEVKLDIPEELDLSAYKATGPQDGETLVPDEVAQAPSQPEISEAALGQLMDMGFGMNGCKRALMAVGGSNTEAAMNWIFEHNMDPDFNDPLPEPSTAPAPAVGGDGVDDAVVSSLVDSLGCFTFDQVRAALKETSGAADRAADWLFSHMDDLDGAIASLQDKNAATSALSPVELDDGPGKYRMVGMVSHIGKNTGSGHYVAHIKHDGKWVIFNDEKVALSENPPIPHAYLYLYQRMDTLDS
eukprot:scaffold5296_cov215-Cylindrotheca_fusiformis.AAC.7